jgi:zinc finger SWIM domain-containing protein 3
MKFRDSAEAWEFWVEYGGHIGFDVRKRNTIKSRCDGTIPSCRFVCSNEGLRRKSQTDHEPKRIRAKTRTNCKVWMIVSFDRVAKLFEVTEVHLEHNHLLLA